MKKIVRLTENDLTRLVKKVIKEGFTYRLPGGTIKDTGDKWPDVLVKETGEFIHLSQTINGKKSTVILNKKQFGELI